MFIRQPHMFHSLYVRGIHHIISTITAANKYTNEDPALGCRLADLSIHQSHDEKIARTLESGRCYGMRQQFYQMHQRRLLNRQTVKTQEMW